MLEEGQTLLRMDGEAKYVQLAKTLIPMIQRLPVGHCTPSEQVLQERYSVSRCTVRAALQKLEREGYLAPRRGLGHVKIETRLRDEKGSFISFTEQMKSEGRLHSTKVTGVSSFCSSSLASLFGVGVAAKFTQLDRQRFIDGRLAITESTYIQRSIFKKLDMPSLLKNGIYFELRRIGAVTGPISVEEELTPIFLSAQQSALFGLPQSVSVMGVLRLARAAGKMLEKTTAVINPKELPFVRHLRQE